MSDASGGRGEDEKPERSPSDDDAALRQRLRDLQGKLQQRHVESEASGPRPGGGVGGMGQALKLGSEFVAAVLVGFGIGWLIDQGLGTSPWGLIIFVLLGFGAGVLNVMRSAGVISTPTLPPDSGPPS
jgi:ATP synthase protein I